MAKVPVYVLAGQSNATPTALAQTISQNLSQYEKPFKLVHDATAGTALAANTSMRGDWNIHSPGELYDALVMKVDAAMEQIRENGDTPVFNGVFWVQGESDATAQARAVAYSQNLKELIGGLRAHYGTEFSFVISELRATGTDYPYHEVVRQAEHDIAATLTNALLIDTETFSVGPDGTHYSSSGRIALGNALADAMHDQHIAAYTRNNSPVGHAAEMLASGTQNTPYELAATQLIKGFTDPDDDKLFVVGLTADHAAVRDAGDGSFIVKPEIDYSGPVVLNYQISDGIAEVEATQTFFVKAINSNPYVLSLSASSVSEYANNGTLVGTLSVSDVAASSATYTLLDDAGGRFAISGNQLVIADGLRLDYEQNAFHTVKVGFADSQGRSFSKDLTIAVGDISPENVRGDGRGNTLWGGSGNDKLSGNSGADHLIGGAGNDVLSGGEGDDTIHGGVGNDRLIGGTGADELFGGLGDDTYFVDANDQVTEYAGEGTDTVRASFSYTLDASIENLTLDGSTEINGTGNALNNKLSGNNGANILSGEAGNDVLIGAGGDDFLSGGAGKDTLKGGTGNDAFFFDAADTASADKIIDFGIGDKLVFSVSDYGLRAGSLDDGNFRLSGETASDHGEFVFKDSSHSLFWDPDGFGGADSILLATFTNGATINVSSFLITA